MGGRFRYFGDWADGLNNRCPPIWYAPIACCPSDETSQSAKIFAASNLAGPCFRGSVRSRRND